MDCLDRTNVVQSLLAGENLKTILTRLRIVKPGQDPFQNESFQTVYRNVWADHADLVKEML